MIFRGAIAGSRFGRAIGLAAALSLCALPEAGCSSGDSGDDTEEPTGVARTDVLNALLHAPDGGITVVADGLPLTAALQYQGVQTRTLISWSTGLPQEIVTFEVRDSSNGATIVGPIDYVLDALTEYGTLVIGDLNVPDGALAGDLMVFEKDLTAPGPGNVRFLLVHAMPGRGAVDLYFEGVNPLARVAQDVAYTETSAYVEDRSTLGATNRLVVTPTGFPPGELSNVVEIDDATMDPGKVYIIVLLYGSKDPLPGDTDIKIYQQLQ